MTIAETTISFWNWQVPITSAEYYHSSRPQRGENQAAFCLVIFLFLTCQYLKRKRNCQALFSYMNCCSVCKDNANSSHIQILLCFFMGSLQFTFKLGATHHEPRLLLLNQYVKSDGEGLFFTLDYCFDRIRNVLQSFWGIGIDSESDRYAFLSIPFVTVKYYDTSFF